MSGAVTTLSAPGATPRDSGPGGPAKWAGMGFAFLVYAFLYLPVLVMAVFSFNEGSVQSLPLQGFSTKWYEALANDEDMINALLYSAQVSLIAVTISCVAGTGFAMLFTRLKMRGLSIAQALIALPFVMPGMVLGISLLLALREVGVQPGLLAIVLAHVTFITPIVIFVVAQRLRTLDPSLEQASQDLGAGPVRTFINVVFPSIRTTLLAAALLGFTVSFDEVIVTFFVSGVEQTLPVHIWTLLRQGFSPVVNAILTLIAIFSVAIITLATVILARSRRADV
ncbi:MAG: ABC transporter permease [Solirubrobacterales bacterium]